MGDVATKEGRTVLFVSHNMGAVSNLCNSGILLQNGMVKSTGITEEVINEYISSSLSVLSDKYTRPRKDCSNKITITNVRISPPKNFDDKFSISINYKLNNEIDRFSIEWFIRDIYGQRILSGLSVLADKTWFIPQSEIGEVVCSLDHWRISGGQYSLSVMISTPFMNVWIILKTQSHLQLEINLQKTLVLFFLQNMVIFCRS